MKDGVLWSALPAFVAVAELGSLGAAARQTGQSPATLSRHLTRLEGALGKRLFLRGKRGYALTSDGRELLPLARDMARQAERIQSWSATAPIPGVRVSAGSWTALWLARNLPWAKLPWQVDFVSSVLRQDIARREVDIGIRNRRPTQSWLAGRLTRRLQFAAFARDASVTGWIELTGAAAQVPSFAWIRATTPGPFTARASSAPLAAALASQGCGRIILPLFAAPLCPDLRQIGPEIPELACEEWLVCHHEARHDPVQRRALEDIARALGNAELAP